MKRRGIVIGSLAVLLFGAVLTSAVIRRPFLPPAERGRRLAGREGCFGCHGPEGAEGAGNPGRPFPQVPDFQGDQMMYSKTPDDVRAWIRDGKTSAKASSESWKKERDAGALVMPAYGHRLSAQEIDDLVAFVTAVGGRDAPEDTVAEHGRERARKLGCVGCHGPDGRFARPNPGSLKGYIPSWDGKDFPELVRNRAEFEEWVRKGISARFDGNPMAKFFLKRATVRMPGFDRFLEPGDVDALWAYLTWVRSGEEGPTAKAR